MAGIPSRKKQKTEQNGEQHVALYKNVEGCLRDGLHHSDLELWGPDISHSSHGLQQRGWGLHMDQGWSADAD